MATLIAVETKNLLSSVICVGAIGFGASILFLLLRAPDIAMTQIVIEILGLIILIRATISRDLTFISGDREFFKTIASIVVVVVICIVGVFSLHSMPKFGEPIFADSDDSASQTYIKDGLEKTGAPNIVSSVILDFRAYDTLGEATVLFTSIIGVTVIMRTRSRKKLEETDE
jgi:multisubunit Na+/H+ antiporter MnhB subunit